MRAGNDDREQVAQALQRHTAAAILAALAGVSDVRVDLATGAVTVTSQQHLDTGAVRGAVEEAGYQLTDAVSGR